jgi:hypothetical protein
MIHAPRKNHPKQVGIDLDDGMKINYGKFDAALKKIPGIDAKGKD